MNVMLDSKAIDVRLVSFLFVPIIKLIIKRSTYFSHSHSLVISNWITHKWCHYIILPHFCLDINDCQRDSCNQRGNCIDGVNSFTCECRPGFTGSRCEISKWIWPLFYCFDLFIKKRNSTYFGKERTERNNNTKHKLKFKFIPLKLICYYFYLFKFLPLDNNDCSPNPCQNGGRCFDRVNDFRCQCRRGYSGKRCEKRKLEVYNVQNK